MSTNVRYKETGQIDDDLLTLTGFAANEIRPKNKNGLELCSRVKTVVAYTYLWNPSDFSLENFASRYGVFGAAEAFAADGRRYFALFRPTAFVQFEVFSRVGEQATVTKAWFPISNVLSKIGKILPFFGIFFGSAGKGKILIVALIDHPHPVDQMPSGHREVDCVIGNLLTVTGSFEALELAVKFLAKIAAIFETECLRGQSIAHERSIISRNQKGAYIKSARQAAALRCPIRVKKGKE